MNHAQVVDRYAARKANPRQGGSVEWKAGNVFCRERAIYSYGSHFPMAFYLGERDGEPVHLLNGDKYSVSTSKHQRHVQSACPGFTVSFSALNAAGVWPSEIQLENVLDVASDIRIDLTRADKDSPWRRDGVPFKAPGVGEIRTSLWDETHGEFHAPGAALLRTETGGNDRYFLATSDEGTYCVMELSRPAFTIADAFESLKPMEVTQALAQGLSVLRQGEWFFVPCDPPKGRTHAKQGTLPRRDDRGNRHVVRMLETSGLSDGTIYCVGSVYHRNERGERSGQHRTLKLATWHRAYRNTERASWTVEGKVD